MTVNKMGTTVTTMSRTGIEILHISVPPIPSESETVDLYYNTTALISTTNVGPLTTTFTPPQDCSTPRVFDIIVPGLTLLIRGGEVYSNGDFNFASSCFPPITTEIGSPIGATVLQVYSPGSICPFGYTSACLIVSPGASIESAGTVLAWSAIASGDTVTACCPT